jgi:hypothetical protein
MSFAGKQDTPGVRMTGFRQKMIGDALVIAVAAVTSIALMIAFGVSVVGRAAPGVSLTLLASVADVPAVMFVGWLRFRPESGVSHDAPSEEDPVVPPELVPALTPEGRGSEVASCA